MTNRLTFKADLIAKKIVLILIKIYQTILSPLLGNNCRFYPSCSNYAVRAIEKYGFFIGFKKSFVRILKCHPFHCGGKDMP